MSVGELPINPPLRGQWPTPNVFPERATVLGRPFVRSSAWSFPYPDVAAQYREDVDRNSMHLRVFNDGHYDVTHIDEANPEHGLVLEHAIKDVSGTFVGGLVLTAVGTVGAIFLARWLLRS